MTFFLIIIFCVIVFCVVMGRLAEMGFRNQGSVYNPLYKCWFDLGVLNEEQESRFISGCDRLAEPPKGTKRKPFWKEQPTLGKKIMTFIFMGNRPKPGSIDSTKYTKEHYIKIITSIDADKEECNNRIFYEKTEALAGYMNSLDRAEIASKEELVLKTGLYIFKCHGDNHTFVELHEMTKGEKLWKYYMNIELDGL